jgi:hypothetical protein
MCGVPASIFFSYSHSDESIARRLATFLDDHGFRVWIDEGELSAGDSIIERVAEALDEVDFVAALVSEHSLDSSWCRKELSLAMTGELASRGVKVLPLRLGNATMPATLRDKFYLDVDPNDLVSAGQRLASDVRRHIERGPAKPKLPDLVGEVSLHDTDTARGLLAQYRDWFDSGDYMSCFGDWIRRTKQARLPSPIDDNTRFWLNSLAALSGLRTDGANPSYISMFAGTAERVMDHDDLEQKNTTKMIRRLYFA